MTTVWLANTGSLLLPVSNLTNLLAESDPSFGSAYLARSWLPATVAVLVPVAILAVVSRKALAHRYTAPAAEPIADRVLFGVAAAVVALLVPALALGEPLLHVPVWVPATGAAVVLAVVALVRRPRALSLRLLPVPLVLFVCGLFLAVTALGRLGLTEALTAAAGTGMGPLDLLRLAGVGTLSANVADNLPAYLALEPVAGNEHRLLALLVAVNAGPLITPWASLATLLWHARLTALGVRISWLRFAGLGLIAAPLTVVPAVLAVLIAS
jgi:Na+/H+ antiporter NhaD/arsenite permease-like protein